MATYKLKRKLYADDGRGGMSTGAKVLTGAAALAGGFAAAKTGMLGSTLAKGANKAWASAGNMIGSKGMIESGAKGYGNASMKAMEGSSNFTRVQAGQESRKFANEIRQQYGQTLK